MNFLHIKFGSPVDPAFLENMRVKADACDEHHLQAKGQKNKENPWKVLPKMSRHWLSSPRCPADCPHVGVIWDFK